MELIVSAKRGDFEGCKFYLSAGIDVDFKDNTKYHDTSLSWAVWKNNRKLVDLFIEHGANIHVQTRCDGNSLLMWCAMRGFTDLFIRLLDVGCSLEMVNNVGKTVYDIAKPDIKQIIHEYYDYKLEMLKEYMLGIKNMELGIFIIVREYLIDII